MHFHILVINFKYSHFDPANSLWTYKGVIYERMYMFPTSGIIQKFRLIKHAYIEPCYARPHVQHYGAKWMRYNHYELEGIIIILERNKRIQTFILTSTRHSRISMLSYTFILVEEHFCYGSNVYLVKCCRRWRIWWWVIVLLLLLCYSTFRSLLTFHTATVIRECVSSLLPTQLTKVAKT